MYQYDKQLDFHALGREIKRKREAKGWTQEYLAQLVDRTPRSIMYMENRGQKPSLNVFYQLVTLLEISVDQFFFPDKLNGESTCRKQIDVMLNSMDEKELTVWWACSFCGGKTAESAEWPRCPGGAGMCIWQPRLRRYAGGTGGCSPGNGFSSDCRYGSGGRTFHRPAVCQRATG